MKMIVEEKLLWHPLICRAVGAGLLVVMLIHSAAVASSSVGALNVTGPNAIEPTLFSVTKRRIAGVDGIRVEIQWWPSGCSACVSSATADERTIIQGRSGSADDIWSLAEGVTYQASALLFQNNVGSELSVLILSD